MRSIWTGALSFGLIYIPVRLYNASEPAELEFDLLRRQDLCRIRYAKVCRDTGDEVPNEEIVKGYEFRKGEYVVVEDEDFKRASVKKTQTIELVSFISADEVDQKLLEKPYYLEPIKQAKKAYALLRSALAKTGRAGVARFVLRTREHMAILKAENDVLVLNQMRYSSELRSPAGLELPGSEDIPERELDLSIKLIDQLTEPFHPELYQDAYVDELMKVIQAKAEGRTVQAPEEQPVPSEVTDLFAKLRESLEQAKARS